MRRGIKWLIGGVAMVALTLALLGWWAIDRPFGGARCYVNFKAKTYEQALQLRSDLTEGGTDATVSGLKDGRPPALPVVTARGGFWMTEGDLEEEVLAALEETGGGRFDQCTTPSLGA
jgi:hypothetical protein